MNALQILKAKGADIDQEALRKEFMDYIPRRLEREMMKPCGCCKEQDQRDMMHADALDIIDFHYRRYLKGTLLTLHRITHAFRLLPKERFFEGITIMDAIYCTALVHEFYELCTRHQSAKKQILALALKLYAIKTKA